MKSLKQFAACTGWIAAAVNSSLGDDRKTKDNHNDKLKNSS
jgi:hypothetical protein